MKRQYLIHISPRDLQLEVGYHYLKTHYAMDGLLYVQCALRNLIENGQSLTAPDMNEIISYISETICKVFETDPNSGSPEFQSYLQSEVDRSVAFVTEILIAYINRLAPYVNLITHEISLLNIPQHRVSWEANSITDTDFSIEVSDV